MPRRYKKKCACPRTRAANGRYARAARPARRRAAAPRLSRRSSNRRGLSACAKASEESSSTKISYIAKTKPWQKAYTKLMNFQDSTFQGNSLFTATSGKQALHNTAVCSNIELGNLFGQAAIVIPTAVGSNSQLFIKSINTVYRITNTTTSPVTLMMYHWIQRNPCEKHADVLMNDMLSAQTAGTGTPLINAGQKVRATPFQATGWGHYYKVIKTRKAVLQPGSTHTVFQKLVLNYLIKFADIDEGNAMFGQAGLTRGLLVCAYGGLCQQDASPTVITTAPVQCIYDREDKYKWYLTSGRSTGSFHTGGYTTIADNLCEQMNQDSGAPQIFTKVT